MDRENRELTFVLGPHFLAILGPYQAAFSINFDKVVLPFLTRQIPYLLGVQPLSSALGKIEVFPMSLIKPVEEVLRGVLHLPMLMILPEVTAVSVFRIHEFEPILQLHHLCPSFAEVACLLSPALQCRPLVCGQCAGIGFLTKMIVTLLVSFF